MCPLDSGQFLTRAMYFETKNWINCKNKLITLIFTGLLGLQISNPIFSYLKSCED